MEVIMGKCHKGKFKVNVNVEEPDGYVDIEIKQYQPGCKNKPPINTDKEPYHTGINMTTLSAQLSVQKKETSKNIYSEAF